MLSNYQETGFPSVSEAFWPSNVKKGKLSIDVNEWPNFTSSNDLPLLGYWAAYKNWGPQVGEEYRKRTALQFELDRLDGTARDKPIHRRALACTQIIRVLLSELCTMVLKKGTAALDKEVVATQRLTTQAPEGSRAMLAALERKKGALNAWAELGGRWDATDGHMGINRALGTGSTAQPKFPWASTARVSINDVTESMYKQATGAIADAKVPFASRHSTALAMLKTVITSLEAQHNAAMSGSFNVWLRKGLQQALQGEHVDILPWTASGSGYANPKQWVRVLYEGTAAARPADFDTEDIVNNSEEEDEDAAMDAHLAGEQAQDFEDKEECSSPHSKI
ncbi:hypothetical protein CALVIDRAFT_569372 [Calocera viscosa TUFC12733]|uniref:Uncharacterized protein n=1 Tax=Calocera viscosa (strain TUFC12733) TaxID=1330018 RepID=A0A167G2U3_CALVF|nr:hypothetical protein CALVIDRAFT_569372 [Calocera viscosa TUFC12733]